MTSNTDIETASDEFALPGRLDTDRADALMDEFRSRRGAPLKLYGDEVQHIGARCLGVLIAASKSWAADDQPFEIVDPSGAMQSELARMGASVEMLCGGCADEH